MKTVWKYPLNLQDDDPQILSVPSLPSLLYKTEPHLKDQVLTLDMQNGTPCLWVMVDDTCPIFNHPVIIVGTGRNCGDMTKDDYLGSFQCGRNLQYVYHVFGR